MIGRAYRFAAPGAVPSNEGPARAAGRRGEDLAHRRLQGKGFVIVARNFRLPSGDGEADLIAWDGATLVFVEGKPREGADLGPAGSSHQPGETQS